MNSLFDDTPLGANKSPSTNVFSTLGASNHSKQDRAEADLYCTHPDAVERLLEIETFQNRVWEPCCGLGHMSDVLERHGYEVRKSDIISRREDISQLDFLSLNNSEEWDGDIITNPPYNRDLAQYVNKPQIFKTCSFAEFQPRKGFKCAAYLSNPT